MSGEAGEQLLITSPRQRTAGERYWENDRETSVGAKVQPSQLSWKVSASRYGPAELAPQSYISNNLTRKMPSACDRCGVSSVIDGSRSVIDHKPKEPSPHSCCNKLISARTSPTALRVPRG